MTDGPSEESDQSSDPMDENNSKNTDTGTGDASDEPEPTNDESPTPDKRNDNDDQDPTDSESDDSTEVTDRDTATAADTSNDSETDDKDPDEDTTDSDVHDLLGVEDPATDEDDSDSDDPDEPLVDELEDIDETDEDAGTPNNLESVDEDTDKGANLFEMAADSETDSVEEMDDEEFEQAITTDTRSAEEILQTLEDTGALDPTEDSDIELTSEDLQTDDYTPEFLETLFPLLQQSGEWIEEQYDTETFWHPDTAPVVKDLYTWEHFKIEYYYTEYDWETFTGTPPTGGEGRFEDEDADEEGVIPFKPEEYLSFKDDEIESVLHEAASHAEELQKETEKRIVHTPEDLDEDDFFSTRRGNTTVVTRYDIEKAVPFPKKDHFEEIERYWVNKPFCCVILYRSTKENEVKYYVIQPYLNPIEENVLEFLIQKLRNTIKYAGGGSVKDSEDNIGRAEVIERETYKLLDRYNIYEPPVQDTASSNTKGGMMNRVKGLFGSDSDESDELMTDGGTTTDEGFVEKIKTLFDRGSGPEIEVPETGENVQRDYVYTPPQDLPELDGLSVRPEPVLIEEDKKKLNEYQVEKLLYYLKRDFVGYAKIDGIKRDINVEDISCDGYNSPVFVYHTDYEQIITNIYHGDDDLDEFVVKLAQRSGKGISKRQPQVDATLPDGSRAQLTLGEEVSDHGTNYTIRQFKDVPFTPIDLINWKTFGLEEMAFLWLCIENNKSLIFAGGTASGKTTSLNAVSLFIPSNAKIVSIEDTREVELPQRNWVASVTRPSFSDDEKGDIDEFDLLEAALRQRPDYIVMGEIRGEEGRTLFQVMSTGHTTYTTFHADSVDEVLKRFTTEPINVSKTLFTALDLVSIQTQTRVDGHKVRRNKNLTEVNDYDAETHEINVQDVYEWQAETDQFVKMEGSSTLEQIKFDRGWNQEKLNEELFKRKVVLAHLIRKNLNSYTQVGATLQAFMHDPDTILALIANDALEDNLHDLREMESVMIDVDPEKEALVPRPEPSDEVLTEVEHVLDEAEEHLFSEGVSQSDVNLANAFSGEGPSPSQADPDTEAALEIVQEERERVTNDPPELPEGGTAATDSEDADPPELEAGPTTPDTPTEPAQPVQDDTTDTETSDTQQPDDTDSETTGELEGMFGAADASEEHSPGSGSIFDDESSNDELAVDAGSLDDMFDEDDDLDEDDSEFGLSLNIDTSDDEFAFDQDADEESDDDDDDDAASLDDLL